MCARASVPAPAGGFRNRGSPSQTERQQVINKGCAGACVGVCAGMCADTCVDMC